MIEFAIQQRRPSSALASCKSWQECADSRYATALEAEAGIDWWRAYDEQYSLAGWEYRVAEVKKRKEPTNGR